MDTIEVTSKRYVCRHIHTTGNRCGSPALTGEEFCEGLGAWSRLPGHTPSTSFTTVLEVQT
jgi:hypothetical protein